MGRQATLAPPATGVWLPMSYDEFVEWSEGTHAEWVDGKGIIFVSASDEHQDLIDLLHDLLARFARIFGLGRAIQAPFRVRLWPGGPHREPDVLFVATQHLDRWTRTGVNGAVDLAIEVISDDSEERDLVDKLRQYAEAGIAEYLALDVRPGKEPVWLQRLDGDGRYRRIEPDADGRYHLQSLPGFWFTPEWFFRDPLPFAEELMMIIAPAAYEAYLARIR